MYDYFIVGHGLAGAVLAHRLIHRGYKVLVFDDPTKNLSSSVAAGLYNPITGRNMVKTWLADQIFPEIEPFYSDLEAHLSSKFLNKLSIYRPFWNVAEQNDWLAKATLPVFAPYLSSVSTEPNAEFRLEDSFGGLNLQQSGYVNILTLLGASSNVLRKASLLRHEVFDEKKLEISDNGLLYRGEQAKRIIFCNGLEAANSKLFHWLPFKAVKGEIIRIKLNQDITRIYNRGVFMVPVGDKEARVGSTYQNNFDHLDPTAEGQNELKRRLADLTKEKYVSRGVAVGVRPATKDRKPFIGKHPDYEHIYMFNGFGSKGVSLVPYFSKHFVEHLEGKFPLNVEVDIQRYYSLYSGH